MSIRMGHIHLLYKYDFRHFIDAIIQFNMIVRLGIRLKSMSVRSWR